MHKNIIKDNLYPLSSSQMNIWNLEQAFKGTPMNNICETIRIRGTFDAVLVSQCLNLVLESDSSLRTRIVSDGSGRPMQYEAEYVPETFTVLDFSLTNEEGIRRWEESITREVMTVIEAPLYQFTIIRIGEHEGGVLVKTHHLISDGWSQVGLINKIAVTYLNLLEGRDVALETAPSYRLHVEAEEKYLASKLHDRDKCYWQETLKGLTQPVSLKDYHSADMSPVGHRRTFYLSEVMNHALTAFCTSHRVAPFAVFYMAVAIYLKRTKGVERFCMGAPVHNRSTLTDRKTTGMFVSTLPFFSELDEAWSFEEFNGYLTDSWLELLRHQKMSYGEIFALSRSENLDVNRLYHLVLSFHNSQAYKNHHTQVVFSGQWHYSGYQAEHICIHLNNIEDEKRYSVNYDYLTQLFSAEEIENFHHFLMNILAQALNWPERPIRELSFIGAAEEEKVLFDFNRTERFMRPMTIGQKLREVCRKYAMRVAVIENNQRFTYDTFWARAQAASQVILSCAQKGTGIVALMLPRSFSLLTAMAGTALAGRAWVILQESLPMGRVEEILRDSCPELLIGSTSALGALASVCPQIPVMDMDKFMDQSNFVCEEDGCHGVPEDLAYVIYTSGSTGKPKGVEIEQRSLLNFAEAMAPYYGTGAVLSICNTGFDAFLLESMVPLLNGQTIVVASEGDAENPAALGNLIRSFAVGFLTTTPSRLQAYMNHPVFREACARLEVILCGGEAFPGSLLAMLMRHSNARIYNQYGPSETTVGVTVGLLNQTACISVGRPMANCRCYVLDKYRNPLPVGVFGELYIAGVCVGRGYHGADGLTAQSFFANPFEPGERMYRSGDIAAWLPDGQLVLKGREDGQVKVRGQRLELSEVAAKLMRHPGVREAAVRLADHEGSQLLVAYYTSDGGVADRELYSFAASVLPDYMQPAVYINIQAFPLTANGKVDMSRLPLPKLGTSAGNGGGGVAAAIVEVFRQVLKKPQMPVDGDYFLYGGDSLNALETLTRLEETFGVRLKVADLYAFRTALGLAERIGGAGCGGSGRIYDRAVDDGNGSDRGGHRAGERAALLNGWADRITKAPVMDAYPLTPPQLGIYFETMLAPDRKNYNMPCAFRLEGHLDHHRLRRACERLVASEPVLRTVFVQTGDGIRQRVVDVETAVKALEITVYGTAADDGSATEAEVSGGDAAMGTGDMVPAADGGPAAGLEAAKADFVRPFDLGCAPLLRFGLWEDERESVVMMDMHHIIGDGETAAMLLGRLSSFYMEEPKAPELGHTGVTPGASELSPTEAAPGMQALSYLDYAWWRSRNEVALEEAGRAFWEAQMKDAPELPSIPADFERSHRTDMTGVVELFALSESESRLCDSFCERNGLTPYMLFTAAFGLFIARISGSPELMTGVPVSNRRSRSLEHMSGLFVNTLPLRLDASEDGSGLDYLNRVKAAVIGLIDHADMPLASIVQMAGKKNDGTGNPLYNTLVSMRPVVMDDMTFGGFTASGEAMPGILAKADLNLEIYRSNDCWNFRLEYPTGLFRKITAAFYGRSLCAAALNLARNAQKPLEQIQSVSADDWFTLSGMTENSIAAYADVPIDRLVDMAAMAAPERPALIFRDETMTMGELKAQSDALAVRLRNTGVIQREHVGILCLRGPQLLVAMMAVLKLGCAYVPMLPSFPVKRLKYMMEISGVKVTLCDDRTMEVLPEGIDCRFMGIGSHEDHPEDRAVTKTAVAGADGANAVGDLCETGEITDFVPPQGRSGDDVCFILFTSGSTGNPKGVMIRHRSISNLYAVMRPQLAPARGGFLCLANSIFDIFITETLLTAAMGNYTVMADEDEMVLPWRCADLIRKHHVRVLEFTPSRARLFVENEAFYECLKGMPVMLMCGEVFPLPLLEKIRQGGCRKIFNLYGPTEVTVYCTMDDVTCADKITVGRIFSNCRAYVLDDHQRRVMPTARGELYFGGACVSAGYVGREDLTKALFVVDPYLPGEILYRSGDIVRLLPDGRLDFVGRADHQVKLNGQRVELAEISRKMIGSGLVGQAAVVIVPDGDFKVLRGFVTPVNKETVDMAALRRYLESELPGYMVPPQITVLDALPVTVSGKTDLKRLERWEADGAGAKAFSAAVASQESNTEATAESDRAQMNGAKVGGQAEITAAQMEQLWREVLPGKDIQMEQSFFEQGGSSLTALNLLSRYYNRGLSMTLAQFYGNPTLKGQIEFFCGNEPSVAVGQCGDKNGDKIMVSSDGAVRVAAPMPGSHENALFNEKPVVLLTGATGFFGVHLLKELLDRGYEKIFCLVRGQDSRRLFDTLEWYFGRGFTASVKRRVHVLCGDILTGGFGLEPAVLEKLVREVDLVIHAAADIRHYAAGDNAFRTNRDGTYHVTSFATEARARLIYISTVSLGSEFICRDPEILREFTEDDFDIGQNWMDNIYLKGKFEGERIVRQAAGSGHPVEILRIGRLVGRSSDGVFQKNPASNAFWGLVNGIIQLGAVSTELADMPMDTTAVDECAFAAMTLIERGTHLVYHLYNPQMRTVREMIAGLGISVREVPRQAFEEQLRSKTQFGGTVELNMLLSQYNRLVQVPVRIAPVCEATQRELEQLGFRWKAPDISRLLMGFLPETV